MLIPIRHEIFRYEHLLTSGKNLEDIKHFYVSKETGKGLEDYLKENAEYEERRKLNRTYLVKAKDTDEIVGYFSLRAGLFTIDDGTTNAINFYSVPAIELSNFAVNSAYRAIHPEILGIGTSIFKNFILPIARYTAEIIGVQALYIYALPEDELIDHYATFGFSRLDPELEDFVHKHVKPAYDESCIFMYQIL
jgi:hypothetical protein